MAIKNFSWKQLVAIGAVTLIVVTGFLSTLGSQIGGTFDEVSGSLAAPEMTQSGERFGALGDASVASDVAPILPEIPRAQAQERLIIRTGELSIVVENTEASIDAIAQFADELGGWVVNSSTSQYDTAVRGNITIRIPAENFDDVMGGVKGLALEVTSENSSGQDVTEEFVDLGARLGNLEATAERVRGFLDETQTVEEALAVNVELGRLEGEIEVIKGRMQYLSESAAFSTISIFLTPDELNQPIEIGGWQPEGIAKEAIEALVETLQGLGSIMIWLVLYVLPIGLILGVPLFFIGRWVRRRWFASPSPSSSE